MNRRGRFLLLLALSVASITAASGAIPARKTALIAIPAKFEVAALPAKVWATVTSLQGFGTLTGFQATGAEKSFSKLGDHVPAKIWSDAGTLFVTGFAPEKELRVTWEPAQGHYLCQKRIVLSASAGGTTVEYLDRYTDDQPNVDETAKQVTAEIEKHVEAFRRLLEK